MIGDHRRAALGLHGRDARACSVSKVVSPNAPKRTIVVYTGPMATVKRVRRSITLPAKVAQQVDRLAKRRRLSDNRVLVELIEDGIEVQRQKEKAFFELAERFRASSDSTEAKRLGEELGRLVFGE